MKQWVAITVTGVVLALGAPAQAAEGTWSLTGKEVLQYDQAAQQMYLLGIINAWELTDTVTCPSTLRRGTVMFQARTIMGEQPSDLAIKSLIVAMGQLGCGWTKPVERPASRPQSGPTS
jgi:hypothetical protein